MWVSKIAPTSPRRSGNVNGAHRKRSEASARDESDSSSTEDSSEELELEAFDRRVVAHDGVIRTVHFVVGLDDEAILVIRHEETNLRRAADSFNQPSRKQASDDGMSVLENAALKIIIFHTKVGDVKSIIEKRDRLDDRLHIFFKM